MKYLRLLALLFLASLPWLTWAADGQPTFNIKALAEKKVSTLPEGALYWRVENLPTRAEAEAASGPLSLVAEAAGKVWLFTLAPAGGTTPGAMKVAEIGPIPRFVAPQYLLRINEATGSPGTATGRHTHPGSEALLVLEGEQSIRTPQGVLRASRGRGEPGHAPDTPMEVSSSGTADLHSLVMFVVDATRPFSSPASLP